MGEVKEWLKLQKWERSAAFGTFHPEEGEPEDPSQDCFSEVVGDLVDLTRKDIAHVAAAMRGYKIRQSWLDEYGKEINVTQLINHELDSDYHTTH